MAKKDLAKGDWTEIITILVTNAANSNLNFKLASLMTLGYICEGVNNQVIKPDLSNQIFSAIAANITSQEVNNEVKLVALTALNNSLQLASHNMQNKEERDFILNMLYQTAIFPDEEIRKICFQIFCDLMEKYYDLMAGHLNEIGTITVQAIKTDTIDIAILAIEVWNQIGDIEINRAQKQNPMTPVRGFIMTAAPILMPIMFDNIVRGEFEEDDWDLHKACGQLLSIIIQLTKDTFVDLAVLFIKQNIQNPDFKFKKSACVALGMVLEGPSLNKIKPIIQETLQSLLLSTIDENVMVRESAAWTVSRICDLQFKSISSQPIFNQILQAAVNSLKDVPRIACHACWALIKLIENSENNRLFKADIFKPVMQSLLQAASRSDVPTEHNLQIASFTTIDKLIEFSADDCVPIIESQLPEFISMLKHSSTSADNENLQISLASNIGSALKRVRAEYMSDQLIQSLIEAIIQSFAVRNSVHEEGIQTIGQLANLIEAKFANYLAVCAPYIAYALQKQDAVGLCNSGTLVLGDIARALGDNCKSLINDLITPLVGNLQNDQASSSVKVRSIESLADVASNSKEAIVPYLPTVLALIDSASQASLRILGEDADPDLLEYFAELREAILQFYEGLVQGLIGGRQLEVLIPYTPGIVQFALISTQDQFRPNQTMHRTAIGIIGDIADAYKDKVRAFIKTQEIIAYIQRFKQSNSSKLREISVWASQILNNI